MKDFFMVDRQARPAIIRQCREAHKLSQGELAALMGFGGFVTVSRHERGERTISNAAWLAYCHILGIDALTGDAKTKSI